MKRACGTSIVLRTFCPNFPLLMLYNETRVVKEMDLFEVFCSSIELIEEELRNEDLDIPYLAKRLYISPYYSQRLFCPHGENGRFLYP